MAKHARFTFHDWASFEEMYNNMDADGDGQVTRFLQGDRFGGDQLLRRCSTDITHPPSGHIGPHVTSAFVRTKKSI